MDAADYERVVAAGPWYLSPGRNTLYARQHCKYGGERLHRFLLGGDAAIDHVNGDGLDNRRSNLRIATTSENGRNRGPQRGSESRFKGVSRSPDRNKCWYAQIQVQGKRHFLGAFYTQEEAAHAYDAAAIRFHGEFAWTNFPHRAAAGRAARREG